jgi:PBSX family phage portal protein
MTDEKKPEGRVIAGGGRNIFSNANGGRNDYGALILNALTGLTTEELAAKLEAKGLTKAEAQRLQKDIADGGEVSATLLDSEDQFFRDYLRIHAGPSLIAPPIAPERLERLVAENNALEPCIEAMVTNISCTGYTLVHEEATEADLTDDQKAERKILMDFLKEVYPRKSFQRTRKELRRDLHRTGNSYMVLERNALGDLAFIRRAPAKSMRLIKLDEPTEVTVTMMRQGREVEITTMRAERRYVQKVGTKLVYYKEYGAERDLNRVTGEWAEPGSLPANQRAHEVIHDKDIEDVKSPYGMPRWITQLPSVLGSRMAEEHNLAYFQAGGVPPVLVFITGGMVSEQVAKAVNDYLSGGSKEKQRGVAVEVPSSGNLDNERPAQVTVERFGSQEADSTFENYDEKNEARVRRAFRLPGIFLGMSDDYNFATAHASYVVAEAQVFAPEREEEDERLNMTIMREIDPTGMWSLVSKPLSVNDVNLQLRALQMLSTIRGVGVADVVKEISRIADLEIEVSEDFEEDVIGGTVAGEDMPTPPANNPNPPQGDTEQQAAPNPPQVSNEVRNAAHVLAARIARSVQEYDDLQDRECLRALTEMRAAYDAMTPEGQEIVNRALTPLLYNSAFLSDAAMQDVAAGYAMAAFHAAQRETEHALH